MNWKISKIEVASFKAFKKVKLDLESCSLLTLDGPNGYGKTSIFDAIELVLTGRISRIERLFTKIMTAGKVNYQDNLYWNARSAGADLSIKIQFTNGNENLFLARHASAADLIKKETNRANNFTAFHLYQLENFDSDEFSDQTMRNEDFISEKFGESFQDNYAFLNYLEQGQNEYLFSTRINHRKDQLESLINTAAIREEIEKCRKIERKIALRLSNSQRLQEQRRLTDEIATLKGQLVTEAGNIAYQKISTAEVQPVWDKEILFPKYSKELHDSHLEQARNVESLLPLKKAIKIRQTNERLESYITRNGDVISALAEMGKNVDKLPGLTQTKTDIDLLLTAKNLLQNSSTTIRYVDIERLPDWKLEEHPNLESDIKIRDELAQLSSYNTAIAAEISSLKSDLLAKHFKLSPDDAHCPLCGEDWEKHSELLEAINKRSKDIADTLSTSEKKLLEVCDSIAKSLSLLSSRISLKIDELQTNYDTALFGILLKHQEKTAKIKTLEDRLTALKIEYPSTYTTDPEEHQRRTANLTSSMLSKKEPETEELPQYWKLTLTSTFKNTDDFYIIESSDIEAKIKYIDLKARESRSTALTNAIISLQKIEKENTATTNTKEKIISLRTILMEVERAYSEQTISEIELIFHIYSGRLIQNYQRGLGLFIESRDGQQLRFVTAEHSEHDAILSMSTGQISALSLAFFLALNRVYSRVPIILIDDPSQSLDEVNIASLTDLLRCELKDRQLIVSSHEEEISSYMRYRFQKSGLAAKSQNMQQLAKEAG